MTVALSSNFFTNARGLTFEDGNGVTWSFNKNTNQLTAAVAGASGGTVTSVGLADGSSTPVYSITGSPVSVSGTLTFSLKTQAKNLVLAGPTTGANAQPTFRALVAADLPAGTTPLGANPTASIGLTAVNGSATTFMRSDGAPALSQSIAPTWTGNHTFTPGSGIGITANGVSGNYAILALGNASSGHSFGLAIEAGSTSADISFLVQNQAATKTYVEVRGDGLVTIYEPNFSVAATVNATSYSSGSFTGTLTGLTTSVTPTIFYVRNGPIVTLYVGTGTGADGTSNSTSLTMTGLPTALQPAKNVFLPCLVEDNNLFKSGGCFLGPGGTITFYCPGTSLSSAGFTASSAKGIPYWAITYSLI